MDPNATLEMFFESYVNGDKDGCIDAMTDLAEWVGNGGFPPDWFKLLNKFAFNVRDVYGSDD